MLAYTIFIRLIIILTTIILIITSYAGPPYNRAKMYTGHVACCPLVSHCDYADGTDGRTEARPLHYAFCSQGKN